MINRRISPVRATLATAVLLTACLGLVLLVQHLPSRPLSIPPLLLAGVFFTLLPASILEWLVHRYIYHRKRRGALGQIYRIHHQGHHAAIFPTWRYTTNGAVRRHPVSEPDISHLYPLGWRNLISKAAHFFFYMFLGVVFIWAPAWLATQNLWFLVGIVATSVIISDLFVRVHDAIHYPGQFRFVEAQPWFSFIDRHHFIHHVDMEANVNFLLPLADWCFGTLRTTLTSDEISKHGTLAEAKAHPIGNSDPAVVFAAQLKRAKATSSRPNSLEA